MAYKLDFLPPKYGTHILFPPVCTLARDLEQQEPKQCESAKKLAQKHGENTYPEIWLISWISYPQNMARTSPPPVCTLARDLEQQEPKQCESAKKLAQKHGENTCPEIWLTSWISYPKNMARTSPLVCTLARDLEQQNPKQCESAKKLAQKHGENTYSKTW